MYEEEKSDKFNEEKVQSTEVYTKEIGDTTYAIEGERVYNPSSFNKKITFSNKPKTLVKRPNSFLSSNIGPGNRGFAKMAGLGVVLAIFAIIMLVIFNRM